MSCFCYECCQGDWQGHVEEWAGRANVPAEWLGQQWWFLSGEFEDAREIALYYREHLEEEAWVAEQAGVAR